VANWFLQAQVFGTLDGQTSMGGIALITSQFAQCLALL